MDRSEGKTLKRSTRLSSCIIQSHFSRWIPFEHVHVPDWMQTLPGNRYVNDPLHTNLTTFQNSIPATFYLSRNRAHILYKYNGKCSIHLSYFVFAKLSFVTDTHCSFSFIWRERNSANIESRERKSKTWCVKFLKIINSGKIKI